MTTWPATIPQSPLMENFTEKAPKLAVRTEMDAGPAKVRRRTTAGVRQMSMVFAMTRTETATLDTFYTDTAKGGSVPFDFTHPRTESTVSVRFTDAPEYVPLGGNHFRVSVQLEEIPS